MPFKLHSQIYDPEVTSDEFMRLAVKTTFCSNPAFSLTTASQRDTTWRYRRGCYNDPSFMGDGALSMRASPWPAALLQPMLTLHEQPLQRNRRSSELHGERVAH